MSGSTLKSIAAYLNLPGQGYCHVPQEASPTLLDALTSVSSSVDARERERTVVKRLDGGVVAVLQARFDPEATDSEARRGLVFCVGAAIRLPDMGDADRIAALEHATTEPFKVLMDFISVFGAELADARQLERLCQLAMRSASDQIHCRLVLQTGTAGKPAAATIADTSDQQERKRPNLEAEALGGQATQLMAQMRLAIYGIALALVLLVTLVVHVLRW